MTAVGIEALCGGRENKVCNVGERTGLNGGQQGPLGPVRVARIHPLPHPAFEE
jgi:hypothetical protein